MTFLDKIFKKFNVYVLYAALGAIVISFGWCYFTKTEVDSKGLANLETSLDREEVKKSFIVLFRLLKLII